MVTVTGRFRRGLSEHFREEFLVVAIVIVSNHGSFSLSAIVPDCFYIFHVIPKIAQFLVGAVGDGAVYRGLVRRL